MFRRRRGNPRGATASDGSSGAASSGMKANSGDQARWNHERAVAREQLAAQVIALTGIILALMPTLVDPFSQVEGSWFRNALAAAFTLAVIGFIIAVLWSLKVIVSLPHNMASMDQQEFDQQVDRAAGHMKIVAGVLACSILLLAFGLISMMLIHSVFINGLRGR
jgi:hypothetical protein